MIGKGRPVVCVSYLAQADLWNVPEFPLANHGAEVRATEHSIAADAPMTAAVLSALDVPTLLIANEIGDDVPGQAVRRWLQQHRVPTTAATSTEVVTPWIAVVADDQQSRTWFAHLPGVVDSLTAVDLSPIDTASFVYMDCYQLIETAATRVIETARSAGVPLLMNLGGSGLSAAVQSAAAGYDQLLVQTNVDDDEHDEAPVLARALLGQTGAWWVIVTAGACGVVAVSQSEEIAVPAFPVTVRHTHCAGAAFSGGLLYGIRAGWSMERSMRFGSASGALRCARHHSAPLPTMAELRAFIASRQQFAAS